MITDPLHQHAAPEDPPTRFAKEFGVNLHTAVEMLAWRADEEGKNSADIELARRLTAKFHEGLSVLCEYQARQKTANEMRMSLACFCLALGFTRLAGASSAAEIGRLHDLEKQTSNKCLNVFLDRIKLERLPSQRDERARENMTRARIQQLENHHEDT